MIDPATPLAARLLSSLDRFLHVEAASGLVLLGAAVLALLWANSPFAGSYQQLWHTPFTIALGSLIVAQPLHFWVNDGLMTVFFLVVGLELRREMHEGALSSLPLATLPVAAALGGIVVPALIYVAFNGAPPSRQGWAIPTATDIAFAVGVLAILGARAPPALRVLLLALAIVDDLAAILVIAFFYSAAIAPVGFIVATVGVLGVLAFQWLGFRHAPAYFLPGFVVWSGFLLAGIHPTLAGVVLGLLTPVATVQREMLPPVVRVEATLHPWVAYGIMPLFALANAGVSLKSVSLADPASRAVCAGIAIALVVGKPVGIVLAAWLAVKSGIAALPPTARGRGLLLVGLLGGIGFTMSIFIANLAFADRALLASAKLAILTGSAISGLGGLVFGRWILQSEAHALTAVHSKWRAR